MVKFHQCKGVHVAPNKVQIWVDRQANVVLAINENSVYVRDGKVSRDYLDFAGDYVGWVLLDCPSKMSSTITQGLEVAAGILNLNGGCADATFILNFIKQGEKHMAYSVPSGTARIADATQSAQSGFVTKLTVTGGKLLAFFKALISGDFELIGKGINKVKDFLKNNPISRALRFIYSKAKVIMKNPKRWLLAVFGVGAFGGPLLDLAGNLLDSGMKVAKEWLPASMYAVLEAGVDKVVSLVTRLVQALTDNAPVRYVRALLSKIFKFVRDLTMKAKNYVKQKLAAKFVEVNV